MAQGHIKSSNQKDEFFNLMIEMYWLYYGNEIFFIMNYSWVFNKIGIWNKWWWGTKSNKWEVGIS